MKICTNCKKVAEDEHLFCPACGNKLIEMVPAESPQKSKSEENMPELNRKQPAAETDTQPAALSAPKALVGIVIGLIAVIVILLILLIAMLSSKKSESRQDTDYVVSEDLSDKISDDKTEDAQDEIEEENEDISSNPVEQIGEQDESESEPEDGADSSEAGGSATFYTETYFLTIPKSWEKTVEMRVYPGEYNDYFVEFDHVDSKAAGMGGYLFGIDMYMEGDTGYEDLPSYQVLGRLIYRQAEVYTIVVTFPTDVQFDENTASGYNEAWDQIDSVLKTFTSNSMYIFEPCKE